MKTTVKLTVSEMVGFLKTIGTQSMFISMETATKLVPGKTMKAACPFGTITKVASRTGWLNHDYNASVKRKIANALGVDPANVEYENGECWHTHLMTENGKATPVCVNKTTPENGKFYIFYFHRHTSKARYFAANGDELTYEQVKPYFYAKKQTEYKPPVRNVLLNNVRVLKARGLITKAAKPVSPALQLA